MKLTRAFVIIMAGAVVMQSCKSSKNSTTDTRKKDPVAAQSAARLGQMFDKLANDLVAATQNKVSIVRIADGIDITLQPDFSFDSNSDQLLPNSKNDLQQISTVLNRYPYTEIFIEGHADSSGNQLKNKKLSEMRAKNVALFMKSFGVMTDRMAVAGYGAIKPLESNATPEGRRRNRRVVIKIRANEKKFLEKDEMVSRK
jgi:outer membrane protein OmpA-like peptidoglycan-associated protein